MNDHLITLKEYAALHNVADSTIRHRIRNGQVKTAVKFGRDWFIDKNEPFVDRRVKSGDFKGWRSKSEGHTKEDAE